jgi:hypothetical protein
LNPKNVAKTLSNGEGLTDNAEDQSLLDGVPLTEEPELDVLETARETISNDFNLDSDNEDSDDEE